MAQMLGIALGTCMLLTMCSRIAGGLLGLCCCQEEMVSP